MAWNVEYTDEFAEWWETLSETQQENVGASITKLSQEGPQLSRPYADSVKSSRHSNMKELRMQSGGNPLRTFFAFDPRRSAILLIGGDKTGDKQFYDRMIPVADNLYDDYLQELKDEGLI